VNWHIEKVGDVQCVKSSRQALLRGVPCTLAIDVEGQVAVRAQAQVGESHRRGEGDVLGSGDFAHPGASVGLDEDTGA
jgi:hypothetical protein